MIKKKRGVVMHKIIIAEDEKMIRNLVSDFLIKSGYEVICVSDGTAAIESFDKNPDTALILMDVMMPETNGWEACRIIRGKSDVPIIMLTARSQEFDEFTGFECGADDYVTKPFSLAALLKRIEVHIRRRNGSVAVSGLKKGLSIDTAARTVTLDGERLELTLKEYEILNMLIKNSGRVFTRDQLLDEIWGYDYEGDSRTVDSHMARLRTKLGDWGTKHIKTVYGLGYRAEADS